MVFSVRRVLSHPRPFHATPPSRLFFCRFITRPTPSDSSLVYADSLRILDPSSNDVPVLPPWNLLSDLFYIWSFWNCLCILHLLDTKTSCAAANALRTEWSWFKNHAQPSADSVKCVLPLERFFSGFCFIHYLHFAAQLRSSVPRDVNQIFTAKFAQSWILDVMDRATKSKCDI